MSLPDLAASTALGGMVIRPIWFVYLDIVGGVVRTNTSGANITPSGTGEPDLDGHEFIGISGDFLTLSPVSHRAGGSQTVTAGLSGLPSVDAATIALLANPANWRGREARIWQVIRNEANVQQGGYREWHTGTMVSVKHAGSPLEGISLSVSIEGYLAFLAQASNRTYLGQSEFDPDDQSAAASIAIANGNFSGSVVQQPYTPNPIIPGNGWWMGRS